MSTTSPPPSTAPAATLAGAVSIFDPALCCPTGLCGPGVDPALLQVTRDTRWLQAQGVAVERHNLAQSPQLFVGNPLLTQLMREHGEAALPAVLVNGRLLAHGRYPSREEIVHALGASPAGEVPAPPPRARSAGLPIADAACEPGSGCC